MRTKTVAVLPYDPAWKEAFERIKAPLWERLQTWLSAVEHVASTSVEGLWAKPIIDLDLVLKEPGFFRRSNRNWHCWDTSTKGISASRSGRRSPIKTSRISWRITCMSVRRILWNCAGI